MSWCVGCGSDECFDHCDFCLADVNDPHAPFCPEVVGLYPVEDEDLECDQCQTPMESFVWDKTELMGMLCVGCGVRQAFGELA